MKLPNLDQIETAARLVYRHMPATPQYCWPRLAEHAGTEVWLKHENHTPIGAFKLRGGLAYFSGLRNVQRVICATRGNHGQSVAFCARQYGLGATVVVPHGNSAEKNAAMRALGAELVEHGEDFQAARLHAESLAREHGLFMVPSFDLGLVTGVASASLELFRAVPRLETLYVPIGLGSGICAAVAARNALGSRAEIVGVVSAHARSYSLSFTQRRAIEEEAKTRLADGLACRTPEPEALEVIWRQVARIVEVSDEEVARAIGILFECTHNVAEGAGAAGFAALCKERERIAGRMVGAIVTGGNIDRPVLARVLSS